MNRRKDLYKEKKRRKRINLRERNVAKFTSPVVKLYRKEERGRKEGSKEGRKGKVKEGVV